LEPATGFGENALGELDHVQLQAFEVRRGWRRHGADRCLDRSLGGIRAARFEGSDTPRPVEAGRETTDGPKRTTGLCRHRTVGAASLLTQVGNKRREISRSFIRLTLP
jgi:hypothetical protein